MSSSALSPCLVVLKDHSSVQFSWWSSSLCVPSLGSSCYFIWCDASAATHSPDGSAKWVASFCYSVLNSPLLLSHSSSLLHFHFPSQGISFPIDFCVLYSTVRLSLCTKLIGCCRMKACICLAAKSALSKMPVAGELSSS